MAKLVMKMPPGPRRAHRAMPRTPMAAKPGCAPVPPRRRAHDEQAIADLVVNLLVAEGMDALACYSGQAALDMLARTWSASSSFAERKITGMSRICRPADATLIPAGAIEVDLRTHLATLHGEPLHLTPKEFAILALLAQSAGSPVRARTHSSKPSMPGIMMSTMARSNGVRASMSRAACPL